VKRTTGKGVNLFPDGTNITVDGATTNDPLRKSETFAEHIIRVFPTNIPPNPQLQDAIVSSIRSSTNSILNDLITTEEIDRCIPKSQSKAVGTDRINNTMLKNLKVANQTHLQHLFNTLLNSSFIPKQLKKSIIIPLLKPDKTADDPSYYRPISLISCLCKNNGVYLSQPHPVVAGSLVISYSFKTSNGNQNAFDNPSKTKYRKQQLILLLLA
jgi:hypothetical protein